MGKTRERAAEMLARTTAILDNPQRRGVVHSQAVSGLMTAEMVLGDVLGQDETDLTFTRIIELWERELSIKKVNGL